MAKLRPRWMVVSLRGLMLFILVFGIWLGWRVNRANSQRRAVAEVLKAGGYVYYDNQYKDHVLIRSRQNAKPWAPEWLRRWVGDEFFQEVIAVSLYNRGSSPPVTDKTLAAITAFDRLEQLSLVHQAITDAQLARLSRLTALRDLNLRACPAVTNVGLVHLRGLTELRFLDLAESGVTDDGLETLSELRHIESLRLKATKQTDAGITRIAARWGETLKELELSSCPGVTDAGLARLSGLTELETLSLTHTRITDTGLANFRGLKRLQTLNLNFTDVSDEGLAALRAELPLLVRTMNRKLPGSASPKVKPK